MTDRELSLSIDGMVSDTVQALAPGDVVTRYLVVAETIDAETGSRAAVWFADDGSAPWDVIGLARYAQVKAEQSIGLASDED